MIRIFLFLSSPTAWDGTEHLIVSWSDVCANPEREAVHLLRGGPSKRMVGSQRRSIFCLSSRKAETHSPWLLCESLAGDPLAPREPLDAPTFLLPFNRLLVYAFSPGGGHMPRSHARLISDTRVFGGKSLQHLAA